MTRAVWLLEFKRTLLKRHKKRMLCCTMGAVGCSILGVWDTLWIKKSQCVPL